MTERSIFLDALEKNTPEERAAFLEQACGGDMELRRQVEALLQEHAGAGSFLESPAPALIPTVDETAVLERPGTVIGPYKLLRQIGEGGMGTVYLAEQLHPVQRKVALKIIKPGMDSRPVIARFEAERQALALMDHPNIAKVLDAGTIPLFAPSPTSEPEASAKGASPTFADASGSAGRPYFVMELVKGVPITKYCDAHHLTPRERLELFIPVCQAVQHAHQKGIIHRDLKPSNVLIARYDGRPVAKVIDFGVAKATGPKLTEATLFTEFGQVVGTLEYMSPEQAELNQLDIDTRSDIYSLGVLLYELLTGTTPLSRERLKQEALLEVLRIIREEEPPKPSTRLSTTEALPSIAANRGLEPKKLSGLVKGELDWIVMKALEKDRNRRYETANGLAMDVLRYLSDEPVAAGPPSTAYRLKKFLRRNKGTVLAATFVLLALVAGIVGTTWQALRAENARQAEAERADGEANQRRRAETAEQAAKDNAEQASRERDRAEEEKQVAQAVRDFLQKKLLGQADAWGQAEALLQAGRDTSEVKFNPTVRELLDRAAMELTPDKIEAQFPKQPRVQAAILKTIGDSYRGVGEHEAAIAHATRAHELLLEKIGMDDSDTRAALSSLAGAYHAAWKLPEAIRLYEQLRDQRLQKLGPDHPATRTTLDSLADAYLEAGRVQEAIRLYEQVRDQRVEKLGPDDRYTLFTLSGLARAYKIAGRLPEAIRLYEEVRVKLIEEVGPDHPSTLVTTNNLASAYLAARKPAEAIRLNEPALAQRINRFGPDHPRTLTVQMNLAYAYEMIGDRARARTLGEETLPRVLRVLGSEHRDTYILQEQLARLYDHFQQYDEAAKTYEALVERERHRQPFNELALGNTLRMLGFNLLQADQTAEAVPVLRESLAIRQKLEPQDWRTFHTSSMLGAALLGQKEYAEAEPLLRAGYEGMKERQAKIPASSKPRLTEALERLVQLYEALGKPEAAPHYDLGRALADQQKVDEAIACYWKAIEVNPKHVNARSALFNVARAQATRERAAAFFRKTVSANPQNALAHAYLGNALWYQGKINESIGSFSKAVELEPNEAGYHYSLANNLRWLNRLDEAIASYAKAIDLDPKHAEMRCELGLALQSKGRLDEAIASWKKAAELWPQLVRAHTNLARSLATAADPKLRDPRAAVAHARKAVDLAPKDPNHWSNLGVALLRSGDAKAAVETLEKADGMWKDGDHQHRFFLAMAYWHLGDKDKARQTYEKAVQWMEANQPKNEELSRFRAEAEQLLQKN